MTKKIDENTEKKTKKRHVKTAAAGTAAALGAAGIGQFLPDFLTNGDLTGILTSATSLVYGIVNIFKK